LTKVRHQGSDPRSCCRAEVGYQRRDTIIWRHLWWGTRRDGGRRYYSAQCCKVFADQYERSRGLSHYETGPFFWKCQVYW